MLILVSGTDTISSIMTNRDRKCSVEEAGLEDQVGFSVLQVRPR